MASSAVRMAFLLASSARRAASSAAFLKASRALRDSRSASSAFRMASSAACLACFAVASALAAASWQRVWRSQLPSPCLGSFYARASASLEALVADAEASLASRAASSASGQLPPQLRYWHPFPPEFLVKVWSLFHGFQGFRRGHELDYIAGTIINVSSVWFFISNKKLFQAKLIYSR